MARRNDHSRVEIREMALAAAEGLVDEAGLEGLSTRQETGWRRIDLPVHG